MTYSKPRAKWGSPCGTIFYPMRFILRSREIWADKDGLRAHAMPIVRFRIRYTRRWRFDMHADSCAGPFSIHLEAQHPPLVGVPNREGRLSINNTEIATITCPKSGSSLLSLRGVNCDCNLKLVKIYSKRAESDCVLEDAQLGELASIYRRSDDETLKEQFRNWLGSRLAKTGMFKECVSSRCADDVWTRCVLASLCLYFYDLELVSNTEYPSG